MTITKASIVIQMWKLKLKLQLGYCPLKIKGSKQSDRHGEYMSIDQKVKTMIHGHSMDKWKYKIFVALMKKLQNYNIFDTLITLLIQFLIVI